VRVSLTGKGAELRERARAVPGAIGAAMDLPRRDVDEVRRILRRLTANLSAGT
jgi:hypothetical protein